MDEGPILAQAAVPVLPGDTADVLAARVLAQEHVIYPLALRLFARRPAGEASPGRRRCCCNPLPGGGRCHRTAGDQFCQPRSRMSDHSAIMPTTRRDETPEAFLADRQDSRNGFTRFTLWVVIFLVLLLVGMAVFLL